MLIKFNPDHFPIGTRILFQQDDFQGEGIVLRRAENGEHFVMYVMTQDLERPYRLVNVTQVLKIFTRGKGGYDDTDILTRKQRRAQQKQFTEVGVITPAGGEDYHFVVKRYVPLP